MWSLPVGAVVAIPTFWLVLIVMAVVSAVSKDKFLLAIVPTCKPLVSSYLIRELLLAWLSLIAAPLLSLLICSVVLEPFALGPVVPIPTFCRDIVAVGETVKFKPPLVCNSILALLSLLITQIW